MVQWQCTRFPIDRNCIQGFIKTQLDWLVCLFLGQAQHAQTGEHKTVFFTSS